MMHRILIVLIVITLSFPSGADDSTLKVQVITPYLQMHTGPAVGYPVFHVVEKNQWIRILKSKTTWFKVETQDGKTGWVKQADLALTLTSDGDTLNFASGSFADYQQRDFEFCVMGGDFDGVPSLSVFATWVVTENLATELSYSQALGDFSENRLALLSITHTTFPEWRISPYIRLGAGQIKTKPRANLVQSGEETRTNDVVAAGIGIRYYLAQNFVVKAEYQNIVALTERDTNEEIEQWKLGFAMYF